MGRFKNAVRVAGGHMSALWRKLPEGVEIRLWEICGIAFFILSCLLLGPVVLVVADALLSAAWHFHGFFGLVLLAGLITVVVWLVGWARRSIAWTVKRSRRSE